MKASKALSPHLIFRVRNPAHGPLQFFFALTIISIAQISTAASQVQTGPIQPLPPAGKSGPSMSTPMTGDFRNPNNLRHRDTLGRPCLEISASSRSYASTPNLYDHVIGTNNRCLQLIRVKLCYYKSDRCFLVEVRGNQSKETILGTFPAMKYFRYEYQEQH
jgi:hypothetical protein